MKKQIFFFGLLLFASYAPISLASQFNVDKQGQTVAAEMILIRALEAAQMEECFRPITLERNKQTQSANSQVALAANTALNTIKTEIASQEEAIKSLNASNLHDVLKQCYPTNTDPKIADFLNEKIRAILKVLPPSTGDEVSSFYFFIKPDTWNFFKELTWAKQDAVIIAILDSLKDWELRKMVCFLKWRILILRHLKMTVLSEVKKGTRIKAAVMINTLLVLSSFAALGAAASGCSLRACLGTYIVLIMLYYVYNKNSDAVSSLCFTHLITTKINHDNTIIGMNEQLINQRATRPS